jgi:hypothetical protein
MPDQADAGLFWIQAHQGFASARTESAVRTFGGAVAKGGTSNPLFASANASTH